MLNSKDKVAIYMESNLDSDYGKMGMGVIRYLNNKITCVIDSNHAGKSINLFINTNRNIPIVQSLEIAIEKKSSVLILGIAPSGGKIPKEWNPIIEKCARQLESYWEICGTTGILLKNVRDNWNPIEKCAGQLESCGNPGKNLTI